MITKKRLKKYSSVAGIIILVLLSTLAALFWNEIRSLISLEKIDDYGMYRMTYYGDYGFDEFLKTGAANDKEIESFITKRLLKGIPIDLNIVGDGCTAFAVKNDDGDFLLGRNFDFDYAPSLQVYTSPSEGYASVSTVNLSFAGYSSDNMPDGFILNRFLTLSAPFLPFDGMNEKGVSITLLAVPEAEPKYDSSRITLNTTTAIRLVLDKAATTDEAVELLSQYNIYFSNDVKCHYLICDASGHSLIVEYYDNDMQVVETSDSYQIASNFIEYNNLNIGEGFTEFERYDEVKSTIESHNGMLNEEDAIPLLARVGMRTDKGDILQWSVLYNLTTGDGYIFAHRKADSVKDFHLDTTQ